MKSELILHKSDKLNRWEAIIWTNVEQDLQHHIDGLVQDCSISSAKALEILQSCTKPCYGITIPQWVKYLQQSFLPSPPPKKKKKKKKHHEAVYELTWFMWL